MWLFNSHKKLSKINIRSSWSRFEHCSESLIYPLGSHTCSLFAPFHMESWPKVKLGSHYVPLLGFIYSYFAPNIPVCSRFSLVYLYVPIFSFIYLYLLTFSLIWLYLPLIALIWPYMPYTPYIYILLVRLHPCVQNFKTIRKLDDSAFLRTQSHITEICYFEFLWSFEFWLAPHWDFFQKIHLFTPIHLQSWPKSKLGQV